MNKPNMDHFYWQTKFAENYNWIKEFDFDLEQLTIYTAYLLSGDPDTTEMPADYFDRPKSIYDKLKRKSDLENLIRKNHSMGDAFGDGDHPGLDD